MEELDFICPGCTMAKLGTKLNQIKESIENDEPYSGDLLTEEEIYALNNMCKLADKNSLGLYVEELLEGSKNGNEVEVLDDEAVKELNNHVCRGFKKANIGTFLQESAIAINEGGSLFNLKIGYSPNLDTVPGSKAIILEGLSDLMFTVKYFDESNDTYIVLYENGQERDCHVMIRPVKSTEYASIKINGALCKGVALLYPYSSSASDKDLDGIIWLETTPEIDEIIINNNYQLNGLHFEVSIVEGMFVSKKNHKNSKAKHLDFIYGEEIKGV